MKKFLFLIFMVSISGSVSSEPSSVVACIDIISDGDVSDMEGGFWPLSISDQAGDLTGVGAIEIERYESDSEHGPYCTDEIEPQKESSSLSITIVNPISFGWMGHAKDYPKWTIIHGDEVISSGIGQKVNINNDDFMSFHDDIKIMYVSKPKWFEFKDGSITLN